MTNHEPQRALKMVDYSRIAAVLMRRLVLMLALSPATSAATILVNDEVTCPIDDETFTYTSAASGTSMGSYLDSRPFGPSPAPWPIAKCPKTGFVIFSEKFTAEELSKLRALVLSAEYQQLQKQHTNYFLAAQLMQAIGRPERDIAYTLVQASWEAETPRQATNYREAALSHYVSSFASTDPKTEGWVFDQMIAGELERRLHRFKESERRFQALVTGKLLLEPRYAQLVQYQLELIAKRDANAHRTPPASK